MQTTDHLTDDSYIDTLLDTLLDESPGNTEARLMHLLDERELMLAALDARTTVWSAR